MNNGIHSHYCPRCQCDKPCPAVTHCSLPEVYICFESHSRELVEEFIAATHEGRRE